MRERPPVKTGRAGCGGAMQYFLCRNYAGCARAAASTRTLYSVEIEPDLDHACTRPTTRACAARRLRYAYAYLHAGPCDAARHQHSRAGRLAFTLPRNAAPARAHAHGDRAADRVRLLSLI